MRLDADRAHSRPAAAVRNTERLVQIEVADVRTVVAGSRQTDLRVEIGPVEIDLTAALMHDIADLADLHLEDAVGGRIRDHDRRELVGVRLCLRAQIGKIDVSLRIAIHYNDTHP